MEGKHYKTKEGLDRALEVAMLAAPPRKYQPSAVEAASETVKLSCFSPYPVASMCVLSFSAITCAPLLFPPHFTEPLRRQSRKARHVAVAP